MHRSRRRVPEGRIDLAGVGQLCKQALVGRGAKAAQNHGGNRAPALRTWFDGGRRLAARVGVRPATDFGANT